eukprot:gnl/MRDRNA2_/MRDRNA2_73716_c0_seq1.p1 gnl/MRDRNA2_/MRDRNA2_73716_c0~~gnl/MRDRNA2_/MRDRNA2_73716_c0_seq1.p1  ORF type:complete len:110 (-),score=14.50 gnl/MRDRNA2_/MRDRNA2_73716_c0_seq1:181-510(-)
MTRSTQTIFLTLGGVGALIMAMCLCQGAHDRPIASFFQTDDRRGAVQNPGSVLKSYQHSGPDFVSPPEALVPEANLHSYQASVTDDANIQITALQDVVGPPRGGGTPPE